MPDEPIIENPSGGNTAGKTMTCAECGSVHHATGEFDLKSVSKQRKEEKKKLAQVDEKDAEIARLKIEIENRDKEIIRLKDELKKVSGGTAAEGSAPFFLRKGA